LERYRLHINEARVHKEAIKNFDKSLKIDPNQFKTWFWRGASLIALGRARDALKSFDRALKLNPSDPSIWRAKAALLEAIGKVDEAAKCRKEAEKLQKKRRKVARSPMGFNDFPFS